jgi:putative restriction endonuclease
MRAYVANTDRDWFDFLALKAERGEADEVNFWMPNPWGGRFKVLSPGQPLLFKLRSPWNAVAGGGFFSHYTELPITLTWDAFGEKNGAPSLRSVRDRIGKLRRETPRPWEDYSIGCILLSEPFFWKEEDWIPGPPDWKGQIVRDVYGRSCAISRERALPALEAAHIRPFSEVGRHSIRNGILLRSDVHKLFDAGYLTVTPDHHVEASTRMREDFNDGENYLALHGRKVWVPEAGELRPDPEALRWHNDHCFRGGG